MPNTLDVASPELLDPIPFLAAPVIDYMVMSISKEIEMTVQNAQYYIDNEIEKHKQDPQKQVKIVVNHVRELSAAMIISTLFNMDKMIMILSNKLIAAGLSYPDAVKHMRDFVRYFYNKMLNDDERRKRRARIRIRLQRLLSVRIFLFLYIAMHGFSYASDEAILCDDPTDREIVGSVPKFKSLLSYIPPLN